MILNERQYKITKNQLDKMRNKLSHVIDNNSKLQQIHQKAIESEIEVLDKQIKEYELIKSGKLKEFIAKNLSELPLILIKARIAKGLSQRELGEKLGLKEQQIQRYEAELYSKTSLQRLIHIANTLELDISEIAKLNQSEILEMNDWDKFPIKEMYKRNWFVDFKESLDNALKSKEELVERFILSVFPNPKMMFARKHIRSGSSTDNYSLYAWQCRIAHLVKKSKIETKFKKSDMTEKWFDNLAKMSLDNQGPTKVKDYLSSIGIYFIIEPQLPHTYLDGAAMFLPGNIPVIAMTLRYDRFDNFWFVLFHELAHLKKHLKISETACFFDDLEEQESSTVELNADEFSNNILIPPDIWETAIARYTHSVESIYDLSKKIKRSPAIIAGRIRREVNNYTILNELVGYNCVRKLFF